MIVGLMEWPHGKSRLNVTFVIKLSDGEIS